MRSTVPCFHITYRTCVSLAPYRKFVRWPGGGVPLIGDEGTIIRAPPTDTTLQNHLTRGIFVEARVGMQMSHVVLRTGLDVPLMSTELGVLLPLPRRLPRTVR